MDPGPGLGGLLGVAATGAGTGGGRWWRCCQLGTHMELQHSHMKTHPAPSELWMPSGRLRASGS